MLKGWQRELALQMTQPNSKDNLIKDLRFRISTLEPQIRIKLEDTYVTKPNTIYGFEPQIGLSENCQDTLTKENERVFNQINKQNYDLDLHQKELQLPQKTNESMQQATTMKLLKWNLKATELQLREVALAHFPGTSWN